MNILFIVVDTLRANRLGCYGYSKPTSPYIDMLATQGVRFEKCFAPGIPTTPAHATMFTGLHPLTHNIVCHGGQVDLERRIPVLAEMLQNEGYTTAAVDNLFDIKPWFARGFEFYINPSFRHKLRLLVSCEEINARAIEWLEHHQRESFFLFVHYWEPHTPYTPPERYKTFYPATESPFDERHTSFDKVRSQPIYGMFGDLWFNKLGPIRDAEYVSSLYDAEIRHVDEGIAELISTLDRLNLSDETLVILTGDHGESLTEHGIYFDHHGLYDQTIHVPLILRLPGVIPANTTVPLMVQHLDIAQTILEASCERYAVEASKMGDTLRNETDRLREKGAPSDSKQNSDATNATVGRLSNITEKNAFHFPVSKQTAKQSSIRKPLASPFPMEGRSLWPLASGKTQEGGWSRIFCCENTWQSKWAVRTDQFKFIVSRRPDPYNTPLRELYDLVADPDELHNIVDERPDRAEALESELEAWIASNLQRTGRTQDPLLAQDITLGKRWNDWVPKTE